MFLFLIVINNGWSKFAINGIYGVNFVFYICP